MFAAVITTLTQSAAIAAICTNGGPAGSSGKDNYYCTDQTDKSYCLRPLGPNPEHVKTLKNKKALVTEGIVQLRYQLSTAPDPCAGLVKHIPAEDGDFMRIVNASSGGGYYLQVFHKDPTSSAPNPPLIPRFDKPEPLFETPQGEKFYMQASHIFEKGTSSEETVDYFIMLADDELGCTKNKCTTPDSSPIEKYYVVEVFPTKSSPPNNCDSGRPDNLANFMKLGATSACSFTLNVASPVIRMQEVGSGHGGSDYP
jgi:hypothetical protein